MLRKKVLAAPIVLMLTACTTTRGVTSHSLTSLDGYRADEDSPPRSLADVDGKLVEFGQGSSLRLVKHDGRSIKGEFRSIEVREGVFRGVTSSDREVSLLLDELRMAEVTTCVGCDKRIAIAAAVAVVFLLGVLTYKGISASLPSD